MDLRPTARELRWFALMDRHGPLSSEFLFEATRETHRCKDTALRRMQALREAGYLRLPPQQRQIAKADFNPYIYDLTKRGWEILAGHKESEKHTRPTGHWWHSASVAAVSCAIEINGQRSGQDYIPAARILALRGVGMGIPVRGSTLIPDQLFALKSSDGYRAYALEVDRGTEPIRSAAARKSLQRSVMQYKAVLGGKLHQLHFGMKSNLFVLWVFNSKRQEMHLKEIVGAQETRVRSVVCKMGFPRFDEVVKVVRGVGGVLDCRGEF